MDRSQDRQTNSTDLMAGIIPHIKHAPGCTYSTPVCTAPCMCYEIGLYNAGLRTARRVAKGAIDDEEAVL